MGGGGYVAGPAGWRRCSLGTPLVLTEADRHLGLANRLLAAPGAARLPRLPDRGPGGRPVPGHRPPGPGGDRWPPTAATARRRFGIGADERCLLVFGGSQGARSINFCALDAFLGDGPAAGAITT